MIIHVALSIQEASEFDIDRMRVFTDVIIQIHRTGTHRLIVERDVIDWMIQYLGLNDTQIKTMRRLSHDYTSWATITAKISRYIKINSGTAPLEVALNGFTVGVNTFLAFHNLRQSTKIVIENSGSDGAAFKFLIENAFKRLGFQSARYELVDGGGDNLPRVCRELLQAGYAVIAIIDSDRRFVGDRGAEKVSSSELLFSEFANWPSELVVLTCREIENIIPYATVASLNGIPADSIDALREIEASEKSSGIDMGERYKQFFDYRDGARPVQQDSERHISEYAYAEAKHQIVLRSLTTNPIAGFGNNIGSRVFGTSEGLASLHKELRNCPYFEEFHGPCIDRIAHWVIGGERRNGF